MTRRVAAFLAAGIFLLVLASCGPFVTTCGNKLCINGSEWKQHGATVYGRMDDPTGTANLAATARLNTLEVVEPEVDYHSLADTTSERTWVRIDRMIAAASSHNQHVMLNLSSYGQSLLAAGIKPTTYNWNPFLQFVTGRVNTVTGTTYRDDPTIARIALYGEIDAPNYSVPLRGTTQETTDFFHRTLGQLRALDGNHLISSGGFSYINDPNSGIDWRTIMADANNQTCDVEVNSYDDRDVSVPNVDGWCDGLGKPWFLAAWSSCLGQPAGPWDINHWPTDQQMAFHAQNMYDVARTRVASAVDFWNLGNTPAVTGSCDIGPQFPQTFGIVQNNAP